jgi:hypothetical protein
MSVSRQRSASFGAPWGLSVRIITGAVVALMVTLAVVMPLVIPRDDGEWWAAFVGPGVLALIISVTSLFCVRGFAIRRGDLWVRRLFWETRVPLAGLKDAWADPEAMRRSIRSTKRAVVLEIGGRKVVVSPDRPSAFLRALGLDPKAGTPDP